MAALTLPVPRPFNWRVFFIVWALAVMGGVAVVPYALTLQAETLATAELPIPLPVLIAIQIGQQALLFGLLTGLGLLLATRIGLGLPLLRGWLAGEPVSARLKAMLAPAIVLGVLSAGAIIALGLLLFNPLLQAEFKRLGVELPSNPPPPAWQGFLASFYGGISEEVLLRLFLLSLLAWLGSRLWRTSSGRPALGVFWVANLLAAVLFGLGHLPTAVVAGIPLTPLLVAEILVLNGLAGLVFGWLYWTYGLESAMLAHFSADIVLHVIAPLVLPQ